MSDIFEATIAPLLLDALNDYHQLMEAQLQEAHHLDKVAIHLRDKADANIWIDKSLCDFKYQKRFAYILRYSVIISAYGICERALQELCDFAKKRLKLQLDLAEIKGSTDIEKFRIYLDRSGIDAQALDAWQYLGDVRRIRNALVHANGFLIEPDHNRHIDNLHGIVHRLNGVTLTEDEGTFEVGIEHTFCRELIRRIDRFLGEVFNAIDETMLRRT